MPFHGAVDPGVEHDQPEQRQQRREEEVHVLLVDLVVRRICKTSQDCETALISQLGTLFMSFREGVKK